MPSDRPRHRSQRALFLLCSQRARGDISRRQRPCGVSAHLRTERMALLIRIKSLFFPGIATHVIAVLFPETGRIRVQELEAAHPLH